MTYDDLLDASFADIVTSVYPGLDRVKGERNRSCAEKTNLPYPAEDYRGVLSIVVLIRRY